MEPAARGLLAGGSNARRMAFGFVLCRPPAATWAAPVLLAICTLHFIAMGAVSIVPILDRDIVVTISPLRRPAVAAASLVILVLSGWHFGSICASAAVVEVNRMHGLANAAVEV